MSSTTTSVATKPATKPSNPYASMQSGSIYIGSMSGCVPSPFPPDTPVVLMLSTSRLHHPAVAPFSSAPQAPSRRGSHIALVQPGSRAHHFNPQPYVANDAWPAEIGSGGYCGWYWGAPSSTVSL